MSTFLTLSLLAVKAREVEYLLLRLGATSTQADMNPYSVFHYALSQNRDDILDILLSDDKRAALSVLNNVGKGLGWRRQGYTSLTTAIDGGNQADNEDSDDGCDGVLSIFSELVSDNFTIENFGGVPTIVKSNVLSLEMIE
ncbi:unnamed protein product [Diplocarpon coronariae]|uniref:Ankyrin repeat protein n=1 Tax=Diplocarpon coronariae TaxID=2795749 RepID=A0A218Z979_9HELO|nr:hypothetical protein B2J93_4465 [Marssonina coronariae]